MATVDVKSTAKVDFGDLGGRLLDAEQRVLRRHGKKFVTAMQDKWIGWTYKGRPKSAPRNVSVRAWRSKVDSREGRGVLYVSNAARDWRKKRPYVKYVHRTGSTEQEWQVAWTTVTALLLPALGADLAREIVRNMNKRRPPSRIRKPREDVAVTTTGTVL